MANTLISIVTVLAALGPGSEPSAPCNESIRQQGLKADLYFLGRVPGTPYTSLSETKRTGIAWQPLGFHMPIRRTEAKPRRCVGKEAASFPTDGRLIRG
jgi:hypothetical protein